MKKINLLYIGSVLSKYGFTPTSVETLSPLLREFFNVSIASDKQNYILRMLDMIFSVIKRRKSLDFIIIDTYSSKNFYYALLISQLARILNIKYLTCLHGGNLPDRLINSVFLSKLIFNNSVINIAPSKYLENAFLDLNYNVMHIANNIKLDLYKYKERKKITPSILYVRAFSYVYNPQMAIKAFYKLKEVYSDAIMCMVGPDKDGTLEKCIELSKELNIYDSITFTGKITKQEWIELSIDYDIFINSTNFDNQPVSIIEAMALGFPIISTNVGGLPYLIDSMEDGILIEKGDIDMMYNKMVQLIETPELVHKLSKNARRKAELFDWKHIQESWKKILKIENI